MNILKKIKNFSHVCIQCHDIPDSDTIGAAFGVYKFLTNCGVKVDMVYTGDEPIRRYNLKLLLSSCHIPLKYVHSLPAETDLLLVVDGQYGNGNITALEKAPAAVTPQIAIIDHHIQLVPDNEWYLIKSDYQSCSTIVWELLKEEGYPLFEDKELCTALLYGLYIDTSMFTSLYTEIDTAMKQELSKHTTNLFNQLSKSNMSVGEMMIATDAMHNHYLDIEKRFVIISALKCEQPVLGIIGDFMIQVDMVDICVTYTKKDDRYQFSVRSCNKKYPADKIASCISDKIGSGGGHISKSGGIIFAKQFQDIYGEINIWDFIEKRLSEITS